MKWTALVIALLLTQGCNPPPAPTPVPGQFEATGTAEVTINGQAITDDMLEALLGHLPAKKKAELLGNPMQKKKLLESLVNSNLLYREAIAQNVHNEDKIKRSLAMANREILSNMYLSQIGDKAATEEAVAAKYDEMKVKFGQPGHHMHHLMVKGKDVAEKLVAEIKGGADFADVARKNDPRARMNGGDMGWLSRAPIPDLERPMKESPLNEIVGPVESRAGFHIFKITERRDKTPLDEVRDEITQLVKVDAMKAHQKKLREEAKVVFPGETSDTPGDGGDAPAAKPGDQVK
jgi:peptidyl-prolyl cis-trans isomerase C